MCRRLERQCFPSRRRRRDAPGGLFWLPRCPSVSGPAFSRSHRMLMPSAIRQSRLLRPLDRSKAYAACASLFDQCDRRRAVWLACRSVVSSSFGLSRPMRPRFAMSNPRPSALRSSSIKRPQRPFSAFFPWSLRAHSSRNKKGLALAALYCVAALRVRPDRLRSTTAIEVAMVAARERKRTRTWLPSATSPSTATA